MANGDAQKSRDELLRELEKVRAQIKAGEQVIQEQARELSRLKALYAEGSSVASPEAAHSCEKAPLPRHASILDGINHIFRKALTCKTEEELGCLCLSVAEEVTASRFGFIGLLNPEGRMDDIAISNPGWEQCRMDTPIGHRVIPTGLTIHGMYGSVFRSARGYYTNDPDHHPDRVGLPPGHPPLISFLGVPLIQSERVIGMLALANRPGGYRDVDLDTVETLAPAIAQALMSKRSDETLTRQRELLQRIFDNIPILLVIWDSRLKRFMLNRYAEKVLGWTTADANEGDFIKKVFPEAAYRALVIDYLQSLQAGWREWACTTQEGLQVPIDWARIRLSDDTLIGIGVDLRERNQVLNALRESEERYRALFESINEGFCVVEMQFDSQGEAVDARFLETNPAFNWHNQFPATVGKTVRELIPGLESEWFEILGRVAVTGRPDQGALESRTQGRWFQIDAFRVGKPEQRRVAVLFNDITENRRAEQALRESASFYRQTLESIPGMVFTTRPDGYCDFQSQQWVDFTGIPMEEHLGNGWTQLLHPEDRPRASAAWRSAVEGKAPYDLEYRVRRHDGAYEWFRVIARPIRNDEGKIVRWFGVTMNIENLKKAEDQLKTINESLERQVAERTALADARARQLQALAVELIEAEEKERQKMSLLLHEDLQQLLASAKMQLKAICENSPDPILENVETLLLESINKSRSISHELSPPVLQHSSLMPAIQWLIRYVKDQFDVRVELVGDEIDLHDHAPLKVFVFRAVQQLLLNVVKHAGVKTARIELCASNGHFVVVVSDRGKGFDPAVLEAENKTRGLGLGLLSLRERASYIGGTFSMESVPGEGSRFTLKLPFGTTVQEQPASPKAVPENRSQSYSEKRAGKMRVLFVDDHKLMRKSLVRLASAQADIEIAGEAVSGHEAIELARQLRPDVVVMDVSMPGMDGIEATRHIKHEMPKVRVVGLSMFEDEHVGDAMHQAGAETVVSKTAAPAILLQAIYGVGKEKTERR